MRVMSRMASRNSTNAVNPLLPGSYATTHPKTSSQRVRTYPTRTEFDFWNGARRVWVSAFLSFFSGLVACASNPAHVIWDREIVLAKKNTRDGNLDSASAAIAYLAATAPSTSNQFETQILRGDLYLRKNQPNSAAHTYLEAARKAPTQAHATKAIYRLGQMLYDNAATEESGLATLIRIVRHEPDSPWAARSLDTLDVHFGGTQSGRTWLEKLYRALFNENPSSRVAPHLLYRGAMLHINGIKDGDLNIAMSLLTYLTENYPRSALWDNAMYGQANILHTFGRYSDEIATLRRILLEREPSYILGNYETQFYHRCSWRIAQLYAEFLNNPAAAIHELEYFVREFQYSKRFDDALFMLAVLQRKIGHINDSNHTLNKLLTARPNSRLVERARLVLQTGSDTAPPPPWSFPGTQNVDTKLPGEP